MDRVVKDVVSSLLPSDLLIVMGDHGMTGTGDHGGDSDDEVGAAFLVSEELLIDEKHLVKCFGTR